MNQPVYQENLGLGDLNSICNILCIRYTGNEDEITQRICDNLANLDKLRTISATEE